ncbi:hypothetical protein MAR_018584 [Mya arenaria]|uniref:Uncharacterized protein n=1 Tax=Mya arenaria TaxID=6604 RepID=A0ABY7EIK3_MYAAR|nr:hypothetical protein MAR_018584 [Mya arenaria]
MHGGTVNLAIDIGTYPYHEKIRWRFSCVQASRFVTKSPGKKRGGEVLAHSTVRTGYCLTGLPTTPQNNRHTNRHSGAYAQLLGKVYTELVFAVSCCTYRQTTHGVFSPDYLAHIFALSHFRANYPTSNKNSVSHISS